MLRTWEVRLPAIEFTLSVRSFQVPPTPRTCAWPPSFPSVPTSRATRVTSEAKELSWSTIVLMVFFSSRISPFTSTVIFLDRSPFATAVVTSAMLRTWAVRLPAIEFTLSVRSFQVPPTPVTCAWPPSLPSVPTSRATRVTSEANELSWSTIVLMVFLSSRISPWTSTVIFLERSPLATAVVTSAMLRTWAVRLPAIEFTLSVRSFQVPPTPATRAWPPSLPSVPTSRATRVTSEAKELSWSTIVLMVFLSSRISPCTSTVIFLERSPFATAVVTSAMLRTWAVRLPAIQFTLSVRSFQVPPTPVTSAWPPSLPSVPTSRATRVTSEANELSWSTIVLMVSFSSRISPRTSTVIFLDRSPLATAVVTSAMLRTWPSGCRPSSSRCRSGPSRCRRRPAPAPGRPACPSVPTSRATRVTSEANELSWSTIVLMVFLSSRISPFTSTVIFLERSPLATAVVTSAMLRTWPVRLPAIEFTLSVRSFQVPPTPRTCAWPPSLPSVPTSRATRVTSEANELSWSTIVLMVFLSSRISPFTSTVIFLDSSPRATAVVTSAMLRTWAVRLPAIEFTLSVRSFHVPATPFTLAWPPSLPSVPTSRATRVTSEAKELELVHHRVHRAPDPEELAHQRPAFDVQRHGLREVALGHGPDHAGDLAGRLHQVADQAVHRVERGGPRPAGPAELGPLGDPAFLAHRDAHAVELVRHLLVELDDLVQRVRHLPGEPGLGGPDPNGEISLADGGEDGEHLGEIENLGVGRRVGGSAASGSAIAGPGGPHGGLRMSWGCVSRVERTANHERRLTLVP